MLIARSSGSPDDILSMTEDRRRAFWPPLPCAGAVPPALPTPVPGTVATEMDKAGADCATDDMNEPSFVFGAGGAEDKKAPSFDVDVPPPPPRKPDSDDVDWTFVIGAASEPAPAPAPWFSSSSSSSSSPPPNTIVFLSRAASSSSCIPNWSYRRSTASNRARSSRATASLSLRCSWMSLVARDRPAPLCLEDIALLCHLPSIARCAVRCSIVNFCLSNFCHGSCAAGRSDATT